MTSDRWSDLEALFGENGACAGCWCQYWRKPAAAFEADAGADNRASLRRQVEAGPEPGLLAYHDDDPIGWCSVEPRERFPRLANSRILARIDDEPVWSVVCFYVTGEYRGRGVSVALLEAVKSHVDDRGGHIIEGYPTEAGDDHKSPAFVWTGLAEAFERAGFVEVERRSATRPIMRYVLDEAETSR
ncbi:GNAT family N-acetyltransferase [Halobacteriaceae archaeon GCM10025711]